MTIIQTLGIICQIALFVLSVSAAAKSIVLAVRTDNTAYFGTFAVWFTAAIIMGVWTGVTIEGHL